MSISTTVTILALIFVAAILSVYDIYQIINSNDLFSNMNIIFNIAMLLIVLIFISYRFWKWFIEKNIREKSALLLMQKLRMYEDQDKSRQKEEKYMFSTDRRVEEGLERKGRTEIMNEEESSLAELMSKKRKNEYDVMIKNHAKFFEENLERNKERMTREKKKQISYLENKLRNLDKDLSNKNLALEKINEGVAETELLTDDIINNLSNTWTEIFDLSFKIGQITESIKWAEYDYNLKIEENNKSGIDFKINLYEGEISEIKKKLGLLKSSGRVVEKLSLSTTSSYKDFLDYNSEKRRLIPYYEKEGAIIFYKYILEEVERNLEIQKAVKEQVKISLKELGY